jgi:hypothetical protein
MMQSELRTKSLRAKPVTLMVTWRSLLALVLRAPAETFMANQEEKKTALSKQGGRRFS